MVPDGWYGPPGHRGGRLRPKNVSGDNFRVALPYTTEVICSTLSSFNNFH